MRSHETDRFLRYQVLCATIFPFTRMFLNVRDRQSVIVLSFNFHYPLFRTPYDYVRQLAYSLWLTK